MEESDAGNYKALEAALGIDRDALDDALIEQPQRFGDVCDAYAYAISRRDEAEDALKRMEARLALSLRAEHEAGDKEGGKPTETAYKAMVQKHPKRKGAFLAYIKAAEDAERWKGLKEAYSMRSHALKDLANLYTAGYFTVSAARGGNARAVEEGMNNERRKLLHETRQAKQRARLKV